MKQYRHTYSYNVFLETSSSQISFVQTADIRELDSVQQQEATYSTMNLTERVTYQRKYTFSTLLNNCKSINRTISLL